MIVGLHVPALRAHVGRVAGEVVAAFGTVTGQPAPIDVEEQDCGTGYDEKGDPKGQDQIATLPMR